MKVELEEPLPARHSQAAQKTARDKPGDRIWREVVSWFWVILAFLFIEGTLVQARVIPSGSMENTVLIGDHLIVSRAGYDAGIPFTPYHVTLWRIPHRQQIVVFRAPLPEEGNPDFIKRLIGLPGDRIKMIGEQVYVNDHPLKEPYALHGGAGIDMKDQVYPPPEGSYWPVPPTAKWAAELPQHVVNGELVVPPGEYFMMGDNRDNSYDSRFWGFVPRDNIIGTPVIIYMSIDAPEEAWEPGHVGERFATYLSVFIRPREVRWTRLFHIF
ncbi:MAG: signal peptidase I [Candidatus Binataceae bacterium]